MRISTALLCDAATVREGLLHVLGGGVTRLGRGEFPAAMDVDLALMVQQHPTEFNGAHALRVILQDTDGRELAEAEMAWGPLQVLDAMHTDAWQPVVVPLRSVLLPGPGDYSVEVLIDGIHQVSIDFVAMLPDPLVT
ncbi:MAG: hypothetical protein QOI42_526 [Frankiaceae bacterium]|jgi:hypothetical protein|nr:hypothetical protein [Frankiaceae bacterium]